MFYSRCKNKAQVFIFKYFKHSDLSGLIYIYRYSKLIMAYGELAYSTERFKSKKDRIPKKWALRKSVVTTESFFHCDNRFTFFNPPRWSMNFCGDLQIRN